MGQRVAPAQVGDDQHHVRISPANLLNLGDDCRDGPAGRPSARAASPTPGARSRVPTDGAAESRKCSLPDICRASSDRCRSGSSTTLTPSTSRPVQFPGNALGRPLRQRDRQAIPARVGRIRPADWRCSPRCRIRATGRRKPGSENSGRETRAAWQRSASAAPIGSATSLTQYCRRFSSLIGSRRKSRLVDVRVGVEDPLRQPRLEMFEPKRPIDVGVLPNVVQRDGIHGLGLGWPSRGCCPRDRCRVSVLGRRPSVLPAQGNALGKRMRC